MEDICGDCCYFYKSIWCCYWCRNCSQQRLMSPVWLIFLWAASLSRVYFCEVNWWLNKEESLCLSEGPCLFLQAVREYVVAYFGSPIKSVAQSWSFSLKRTIAADMKKAWFFVVVLFCGNPFWGVFSVPCAQMWRGRPATTCPAASRRLRSPAFGRGSTASWPIASSSCSTRRKR